MQLVTTQYNKKTPDNTIKHHTIQLNTTQYN